MMYPTMEILGDGGNSIYRNLSEIATKLQLNVIYGEF